MDVNNVIFLQPSILSLEGMQRMFGWRDPAMETVQVFENYRV